MALPLGAQTGITTAMKSEFFRFGGERDFLAVNEWLFEVKETFELICASGKQVSEEYIVRFAAILFHGEALDWWLSMRNTGGASTTWNGFEEAVKRQFIPPDYERTVMDKLKRGKEQNSASDYIKEFQHLIPVLPDLSEREKWENFVDGRKPALKVEVCRDPAMNFEEASL